MSASVDEQVHLARRRAPLRRQQQLQEETTALDQRRQQRTRSLNRSSASSAIRFKTGLAEWMMMAQIPSPRLRHYRSEFARFAILFIILYICFWHKYRTSTATPLLLLLLLILRPRLGALRLPRPVQYIPFDFVLWYSPHTTNYYDCSTIVAIYYYTGWWLFRSPLLYFKNYKI